MKILRSFMAAFMIVLLFGNTALAAESTTEKTAEADSAVEQAGGTATSDVIVVENCYEFKSSYGYKYFIAVCSNNSSAKLDVSWDTVSFDEGGSILETGSSYNAYVEPNQNFVLYALFLNSEEAANYSYTIHYEESSYIMPACSDVNLEASVSGNGTLTLKATNTSDTEISTIQAATLFFDKEGTLVGFEDSYIVNNNYNVEAGETIEKDVAIPEGTDNYETYYTAYRW
ncbi:hypothetical protein [Butyrivibrio sp. JL13D10]|uniref:hypothetical protein n=1 Tax=Butyrivibrio sp. JL13D10 TaxID=3236815 RepID=UPI0038B56E5A